MTDSGAITVLAGQPIALRPTQQDGQLNVFFCHQKVATIDLKSETRI
jgi:hypothetical protein